MTRKSPSTVLFRLGPFSAILTTVWPMI